MNDVRRYAADLARDLRAPDHQDPIASVIMYADAIIERLLKDGACSKLSTLVDWIANRLGMMFVIISSDHDVRRLRREYAARHEFGAAKLARELAAPDCFGGTFALKAPCHGIRFVAVIDCRGLKQYRSYFTKCHEIAHIILMTQQKLLVFRRTHEEQNHPEEQLVDRVAARVGFFPALLQAYTVVPLSFDLINQIISDLCPEASWDSACRGVINAWPLPAARLRAKLRLKRSEGDQKEQGLLSFLPPSAARLRLESVVVNEHGERAGMMLFQNMRVPEMSIIMKVFNDGGTAEAREDLSWWESKSKGRLPSLPVRVIAKRPTTGVVEAIIVAERH
jgi:hypothetical protein